MKGNVKEVIGTSYNTTNVGGKLVRNKKSYVKRTHTYNKQGQLLTSSSYNTQNKDAVTSAVFTYQRGELVKRVTTLSIPNSKPLVKEYKRILHSQDKDIFTEQTLDSRSVPDTITMTYDHAKQQKTEIIKSANNGLSKTIYTYSNHAIMNKEEYRGGILRAKTNSSYTPQGLLEKEVTTHYEGKNKVNMVLELKYSKWDDKGNWTEIQGYAMGKLEMIGDQEIVYK